MEKQGRPWWHYVLGCGCISIIMAGIAAAALSFMAYRAVTSSVTMDHAKVDAMAADIFPGAKPIEGEDGLFGWDAFGVRMVVLANPTDAKSASKGNLQFILMEMKDKTISKEEAARTMTNTTGTSGTPTSGNVTTTHKNEKVLKSETVSVTVGSKAFPAEKQLVQEASQGKVSRYMIPFSKGHGTAFIMVQGSPDDFNEAGMKQFLSGIDASGLEPLAGTSAPTPAK